MSRRTGDASPHDEGGRGFIGRWSRRKLEKEREREDAGSSRIDRADGADIEARPEPAGEPVLTDDDMPDIDSLDGDSIIADFFSPGVSEALRKQALRKLFHTSAFNVRDGLDDYDHDFTKFEKLGDIVTADMRHRAEMEAERRREAQQELAEAPEREDGGEDAPQPAAGASDDDLSPAGAEDERRAAATAEQAGEAEAASRDTVTDEDEADEEGAGDKGMTDRMT